MRREGPGTAPLRLLRQLPQLLLPAAAGWPHPLLAAAAGAPPAADSSAVDEHLLPRATCPDSEAQGGLLLKHCAVNVLRLLLLLLLPLQGISGRPRHQPACLRQLLGSFLRLHRDLGGHHPLVLRGSMPVGGGAGGVVGGGVCQGHAVVVTGVRWRWVACAASVP
jgi:hypothetical protein